MAETINMNDENTGRPSREEAKPRSRARTTQPKATPTGDAPKVRTPADRKLSASIAEMYIMLGMVVGGLGDVKQDVGLATTGQALAINSEAIAETWMDLAERNAKVKATLKSLTEVSAVGALVGIHVTCAMPLLASRGVVPAAFTGDPSQV